MLYRSTDRLRRRGASMKNLAHSASFHSTEKIAPSKAGIKHLELAARRSSRCSLGHNCHHQAANTFEELKLWNDMVFVDIPKHRRLVCSQCGSWNVRVMPDLPAGERNVGLSRVSQRHTSLEGSGDIEVYLTVFVMLA